MKTVLVLSWDHEFDAVTGPGLGLARGFLSLGIEVAFVPLLTRSMQPKSDAVERIMSQARAADVVISMGAPPLRVQWDGASIWQSLGQRFFLYCLDSLIYDVTRTKAVAGFLEAATSSPQSGSPRPGFISPDRDNAEVISELATCPYVPFAGTFLPIVRQDRAARVAVIGTMGRELSAVGDDSFAEHVVAAAPPGLASRDRLTEFAAAIEQPGARQNIITLAREWLDLQPRQIFSAEIATFLGSLDALQKRRRRALAVAQLRDIPVDFYGTGWEPYTSGFTDCRHLGVVSYFVIPELCRQYKAILNFDTNWDYGLHPRVHTGIGNGCRVITNTSAALADLDLPDADAVAVYDGNDPSTIAESARRVLSLPAMDPESLRGFRTQNSWFARADDFLLQIS